MVPFDERSTRDDRSFNLQASHRRGITFRRDPDPRVLRAARDRGGILNGAHVPAGGATDRPTSLAPGAKGRRGRSAGPQKSFALALKALRRPGGVAIGSARRQRARFNGLTGLWPGSSERRRLHRLFARSLANSCPINRARCAAHMMTNLSPGDTGDSRREAGKTVTSKIRKWPASPFSRITPRPWPSPARATAGG
jgi:hypothetical protein